MARTPSKQSHNVKVRKANALASLFRLIDDGVFVADANGQFSPCKQSEWVRIRCAVERSWTQFDFDSQPNDSNHDVSLSFWPQRLFASRVSLYASSSSCSYLDAECWAFGNYIFTLPLVPSHLLDDSRWCAANHWHSFENALFRMATDPTQTDFAEGVQVHGVTLIAHAICG